MIEQGSPAWFQQRCGKITASRMDCVMAKDTTAAHQDYIYDLAVERLTGEYEESYTNAAMQWGKDQEPFARAAYEAKTGVFVKEVAMIDHPRIPYSGASPDGLVGDDGLVEIKCPSKKTHANYLLTRTPPSKYMYQMQWQMACTERQWCDWVSFDPRFSENLQLMIVRIPRDDKMIAVLENAVVAFLAKVDAVVNKLNETKEMKNG
jgi:putative phage-type endonuclease